ncbi:hypothetical protein DCCM_0659 [Desulfocucumis palustris]|uniref:Uncharacterized protein n=1 Tax=Desulfocucumis palustris TaxID=1898651 RepID=A0A2L2XA15_9FIRM|nr:hypothetical protein DCCM_0659 [Desulfocucumis palustris]
MKRRKRSSGGEECPQRRFGRGITLSESKAHLYFAFLKKRVTGWQAMVVSLFFFFWADCYFYLGLSQK